MHLGLNLGLVRIRADETREILGNAALKYAVLSRYELRGILSSQKSSFGSVWNVIAKAHDRKGCRLKLDN